VYLLLRRWLLRFALLSVIVPSLYWAYLQIDRRPLSGLKVRGYTVPRSQPPERFLEEVAQRWAAEELSLRTGAHLTRARRSELGARLEVAKAARQLRALGHSGNPFVDLWVASHALVGARELPWVPSIDRMQLGRYVRAVRNLVERPPVAGARDESGWSVAGVPGITLDTVETVAALEQALRSGRLALQVQMRTVPAPQAVAIGSPDAVIYDEGVEGGATAGEQGSAAIDPARMQAARPRAFMPEQGCEPMDPPYERFCQGPRKVAMPFGDEAELAERLELGSVQTVGRLLYYGPRADWVDAAGGPRARHVDMLWPAPSGRLWRRFGYVRRPPFQSLLHRGIDVGAAAGTPILAVNQGIVAYSDNRVRGYGNLLVIVHDDASVTFSAHCRAIYVFAGQHVRRGQIVAEMGDTGLARGVHVHWEYHVRGEAADPNGMFAGM
jgi:murein DD-endopeptidase MepM/ murein hydrolase activator NlpD